MLIHTWNEHLNKQVNKLNISHLHVLHSTNAQYIKYMHLGTILQRHKSDSTKQENAWHLVKSTDLIKI